MLINKLKLLLLSVLLLLFSALPCNTLYLLAQQSAKTEWELICSAGRNEITKKEAEDYSASLSSMLKKNNGVINKRKYTEYSKTILTLTAIGKDPSNIGGYNLLSRLEEEKNVTKQGINGPIWALIALDCGGYKSSCRENYLDTIMKKELPGGGWNMEGTGEADPDVTAMALQALSKYQSRKNVREATERALKKLSEIQDADGGYFSWGTKNSESVSQVIIALCELGISLNDKRFVKNGKTTLDNLKTYRTSTGKYMHTKEIGKEDALATEQANTALTEVWRVENKLAPLYDISHWKMTSGQK